MELTLLGTGTAVPSLRRFSSACLLKVNKKNILIDCGAGAVRRLLEIGLTYNDIDVILITHTHPDHTSDLIPFLFAARYPLSPRRRDLPIIGGKGFSLFIRELDKTFNGVLSSNLYDIAIKEVIKDCWEWEEITFSSIPLPHAEGSIGYLVKANDKKIAFSGDTGYCDELKELAYGVDLLVCECSFTDNSPVEGHLTPTLAARIAEEAGAKRLLLTHFYPVVDEEPIQEIVKKEFSGEVILGEDLYNVTI